MEKVVVLLLRRNATDLTPEEKQAIETAFEGHEIEYVTTQPIDCYEHQTDCNRLKPAAVLLPKDRPIPALAMEQGFAHITLTPAGLMRLQKLTPEFVSFPIVAE